MASIRPDGPIVHVSKNGHRTYQLWYTDPTTEKRRWRSTETTDKSEALRQAGQWQAELAAGKRDDTRITWEDFRDRYRTEHLAHLAKKSQHSAETSLNVFETRIDPARLSSVTTQTLSRFANACRADKLATETVASYLGNLHAALGWAVDMELLAELPRFPRIKREKRSAVMRGRPATEADLLAMQAAVSAVFPLGVQAWQDYLQALYLSGLRLGESLILSWSPKSNFAIVRSAGHLYYRIFAAGQKNRTDQLLPIAPEFATWLEAHPGTDRVFRLPGKRGRPYRTTNRVGTAVGWIADAAGVEVTAHDFRRSFGTRWAQRVNPFVLQQLMRHQNITTTKSYYVHIDAAEIASQIASIVNASVNSPNNSPPKP